MRSTLKNSMHDLTRRSLFDKLLTLSFRFHQWRQVFPVLRLSRELKGSTKFDIESFFGRNVWRILSDDMSRLKKPHSFSLQHSSNLNYS